MDNLIDQIHSKVDIVEFISNYVPLKKAGANYKALCPFHKERTPSFFVSPEKQIWHCFGCNAGGDVLKFYMMIENVNFKDALQFFAEKLGLEYKSIPRFQSSVKKEVLDALEEAAKFFERNLFKKEAKEVLEYLTNQRGLELETIKKFRLGYAFDNFDALKKYLLSRGFSSNILNSTGLFIKTEEGNFYDRFRNRIMCPIFNLQDKVIGFSGRIFEKYLKNDKKDIAKYINTPNTIVYNKSNILYLINFAKNHIREKEEVIIVEGNLDAIMSHQAGIKNVVATTGTALNFSHLNLIKRFCSKIIFSFDNDEAGILAKERAIKLALSEGFEIYIVEYQKGKDPADIIKENKNLWIELVENKKEWMKNLVDSKLKKYPPNSVENKKQFAKEVLPFVKAIKDPIEKDYWIKTLSEILNVDEIYLREAIRFVKPEEAYRHSSYQEDSSEKISRQKPLTKKEKLEKYLIELYIKYPEIIDDEIIQVDENDFTNKDFKKLLLKIKSTLKKNEKFSYNILDTKEKEKYGGIFIEADRLALDLEKVKREFDITLINIKRLKIISELQELKKLLKQEERLKQEKKLKNLLLAVNQKLQQLKFK